ncbi:MAG: serine/threonine protein kinase [Alphaproteobacteria bacterium]|nr:serine/threonine protein kinase [Alphaproteobacteria bacterium]
MIGPFMVLDMIGIGANGAVYRVEDARDETRRALKVFDHVDSRKRVRIEQEVLLGNRLRHPNIVCASEIVDVDGQPGLVSDLVDGPSLERWLHTDAPEDLATRLRVFRGVVAGCSFAHEHDVIHRDLKPSNILLEGDLSSGRSRLVARITDFGLAKALSGEVGRFGGLTTVNTGLGTTGYAAPEQVRDATSVDSRADIYSLGCLLYELLTGIAPFSGMSSLATMQAQREGRFRDPREFVVGLPEELYVLVVRMLQPSPAQRPETCEEVLGALDDVLELLVEGNTVSGGDGVTPSTPTYGDGLELSTLLALAAIPAVGMLLGSAVVFVL